MVKDDGTLNTDISKINLNRTVVGAATDGLSKVLLVAKTVPNVKVQFLIQGSDNGSLSSLDQSVTNQPYVNVISNSDGYAVGVYTAPDGYGSSYPAGGGNLTVWAFSYDNPNDPTAYTLSSNNLELVTPPVVLVHGMWSSPKVWFGGGFINSLKSIGYSTISTIYNPQSIFLADYSDGGANETFDPNSSESQYAIGSIANKVSAGVKTYRDHKIVPSQVDIIGHGLGGLMARSYSQKLSSFIRPENYNQGYIHKLITIGTPHRGTPYGPTIWNARNDKCYFATGLALGYKIYQIIKEPGIDGVLDILELIAQPYTVSQFMNLFGEPVGTCLRDFDRDGNSYKNLIQTKPFYTYSITGNSFTSTSYVTLNEGAAFRGMSNLFEYVAGKDFNQVYTIPPCLSYHEPNNDLIVEVNSQTGGIQQTKNFRGIANYSPLQDSTETNSSKIQTYVNTLLLSNDPTLFGRGFPAPSQIPADCTDGTYEPIKTTSNKTKSGLSSVIKTSPQQILDTSLVSVKITSPLSNTIIQKNSYSNILLQFSVTGPIIPATSLFIIPDIGWFPVPNQPPFDTTITIPPSAGIGKHLVVLLVKDTNGISFIDTTSILIKPQGILDSIAAYPQEFTFGFIKPHCFYVCNGIFFWRQSV